ncbi:chromate transporter [Breznakia sp. PF5-3]|uniref:chromate transporter n=1 Tax=unclassified Breznakia TaxID=2623764 RepID=UPI002406765D|nr:MULTISPECIES: chromate transporter [unclassified Breznakia]MDF9823722.1 chromate transporter [Breznakia sp. PM6-1]MDF9834520.1 chromate transporter [Breznakia sp. PF5-3]MDF9837509.1 chromate transporter [Breznakia sp. PFB2-8]MDF9859086.1 chromate transporter [Breznakia sp. PH5-24]
MILVSIFLAFLKIGFLGFGGGYAMLTMILDESLNLGLSLSQFADLNALDMLIPGPIAINAATYVGYLSGDITGAMLATIAVCIPSFVLVSLFHYFSKYIQKNKKIQYFMESIKPSAVGLIASAAFTLALGVIFDVQSINELLNTTISTTIIFPAIVFIACAIANIKFDINPIFLTLFAGVIGYFIYYI